MMRQGPLWHILTRKQIQIIVLIVFVRNASIGSLNASSFHFYKTNQPCRNIFQPTYTEVYRHHGDTLLGV